MSKQESHESYGLIGLSRISGNPGHLFGSALDSHFSAFRLRIYRGARVETDSGESHYVVDNRVPIIEVEMSASQFTELITNANSGDGVPCTVRRMGMQMISPPPVQKMERNKIKENFKSRATNLMKKLPGMVDSIRNLLDQKTLKKPDREHILKQVEAIEREATMNMPYLIELFDEATEKTIVSAKTEVDAFVTNTLVKLGMEKVHVKLIDTHGEPKTLKE